MVYHEGMKGNSLVASRNL